MTPEQQRIAIAEASQGKIELYESVWYYWSETKRFPCKDNDPLNDLNAMHEVESVLDNTQWETYIDHLREAILHQNVIRGSHGSTAAQRAEDFLRTLNLWK